MKLLLQSFLLGIYVNVITRHPNGVFLQFDLSMRILLEQKIYHISFLIMPTFLQGAETLLHQLKKLNSPSFLFWDRIQSPFIDHGSSFPVLQLHKSKTPFLSHSQDIHSSDEKFNVFIWNSSILFFFIVFLIFPFSLNKFFIYFSQKKALVIRIYVLK